MDTFINELEEIISKLKRVNMSRNPGQVKAHMDTAFYKLENMKKLVGNGTAPTVS
jgi:hypothetical protein